jgi:hypothetical protein
MFFSFQKKPVVHLYTICWNEEYMLPYFFRYYDTLVDRYVFFDDGSTDRTLDILGKHPKAEIRQLPRLDNIDSYILAAQNVHNTCWKESRGQADWIIITAVDEFLYAPNLAGYLANCTKQGVTAIPALGYQMISRRLPSEKRNLIKLVKRGCAWGRMNKLSIFDPNKISETNQHVGRHEAEPDGDVKYPNTDVVLNLHYKYLSFEKTLKRHIDLGKKLGSFDKENRWGYEYDWTREQLKNEWDNFERNSIENIFSFTYNPHQKHSPFEERWWRKNQPSIPPEPIIKLPSQQEVEEWVAQSVEQIRSFLFRIWETLTRLFPLRTWLEQAKLLPFQLWMKIPEHTRSQIKNFPPAKLALNIIKHILIGNQS